MDIRLFALVSLVLVIGCTGGAGDPDSIEAGLEPGYGLKVNRFFADYTNLAPGDSFTLELEVKNVGDARALGQNFEEDDAYPKISLFRKGTFTLDSGTDNTVEQKLETVLEPPDLEFNVPGESDSVRWSMIAPSTSTEYPYTFGARVDYGYETNAQMDINVLTRTRLLALGEEGQSISTGNSESTVGPVEVRIEAPDRLILDSKGKKTFPVKIVIENIGDGIVQSAQSVTGDCNKQLGCIDSVKLIVPKSFKKADCDGFGDAKETKIIADGYAYLANGIRLIGGTTGYISCEFTACPGKDSCEDDTDFAETDFEETYTIIAEVKYGYQIEAETDVVVKGTGLG